MSTDNMSVTADIKIRTGDIEQKVSLAWDCLSIEGMKSLFWIIWSIFFVILLPVGLATGYYTWKYFTNVPVPEVILDEWWGEYPIDMKPNNATQPFNVEFSDVIVNDLKERLLHRRPFAPPLENAGFQYGFNSHFLTRVLDFWQNSYNFQERENFLNKYSQYVTNIQGLNIHYIHVRPKALPEVTVVPLLLIHNWPTSVREFYEIIPLLTTPRPDELFVFEVIAPSLPGFGFSQAPSRPGMGPKAIAIILRNLMKRIGREKYYIHGGDFGQAVGSAMATLFPENVLGLHSNMPFIVNVHSAILTLHGSLFAALLVSDLDKDRIYPLTDHLSTLNEESGYYHIQATKPDTIGIGLSESPAGLAAYILEKFSSWTNLEYRKANDGGLLNKFSLTHLIDNIMIYWVTNSITTSMRHFVEYRSDMYILDSIPTLVPTWGIKFKHELRFVPDLVLRLKFKNYLHTTVVTDGGQFPAMEHPKLLANDIYDAVTTFREFHEQKTVRFIYPEQLEKQPEQLEKQPEQLEKQPKQLEKQPEQLEKQPEQLEKQPEQLEKQPEQLEKQPEQLEKQPEPEAKKTVYSFTVKNIRGQDISLDIYRGKVLIIVNVASHCGYTDTHYKQLNELYEKYAEKGLRILAFPCNQFGGQEPGSLIEILQFTKKRNVKFDIFEKIDVNGENTHPLWQFLKEAQEGTLGNFIKWNFSKFIVDRNGVPVERFGPNVNPLDLEPYLEKYW